MNLVPRYLFNDLFDTMFENKNFKNGLMKADVFVENNIYNIEIEIPGFKKEDISIDYDKGYLNITAKKEEVNEDKDYIRKERFYGMYERSFYVGEIDEKMIKANFNDGILKVTFPKNTDQNVSKKNIEIQ